MKIAWFTYFPIEWLPQLPPELQDLPKQHPATWQRVLWEELRKDPDLQLEILVLRKQFPRNLSFSFGNARFHCIKTAGGLRAGSLYWLDTLLVNGVLGRIKPDLVHAWGSEFGAGAIAGRLKYPTLLTMQGIMTWLGEIFPQNTHQKIARFLEPGSLRRAKTVTAESRFAVNYLQKRYPHLQVLQIEHAPNPIFYQVRREPLAGRLLCVSSFSHAKGGDVLIEALTKLRTEVPVQLTWVGARDEGFEQELRARTPAAVWERVDFKNNLTPEELASEYASANLLVYPTRADNSPNAVKEAVVAGLPVVASEIGGIPDYVIPSKNGVLFPSGNAEECARSIENALSDPLFSRGAVDEGTLQDRRDYLSAQTMAAKFKQAYRLVLESAQGGRS